MKVGVIIPTRGDRPQFLDRCLKQMEYQTRKPDLIKVVDFEPIEGVCDITKRYRLGYEFFRNKGFDLIAFIEDDDYYHPGYLELHLRKWIELGQPNLIGFTFTIYYHIHLKKWFVMNHTRRSSQMNSMIKPDLDINWGNDENPYADSVLWEHFYAKGQAITYKPDFITCIGIKHGTGMTGGGYHSRMFEAFKNEDANSDLLKVLIDKESLNFYIEMKA